MIISPGLTGAVQIYILISGFVLITLVISYAILYCVLFVVLGLMETYKCIDE